MSLYTKIASSVVFPLHERLKQHTTVKVRRAMEKSQWLSPEKIAQLQLERLREFLIEAGRDVPYYRQKFAALNFDPATIQSLHDLQRLPLTGKAEIRQFTEQLKADGARGLASFNTGGSSGEPLTFFIGRERVSHDVAAKWRATRWWGVDIGDPEIVVWGSPIELGTQDKIKQLRDKVFRTHLLPAFEMSEKNLESFVAQIQSIKPAMLFGYPSSIAHIASFAQSRAYAMDKLGIKAAFVTSERLYDHQREKIEEVFGCPVANGYGGRDAGFIAHQCPAGGMHITAEDIIVEIVDAQGQVTGQGESGEIVVTHMATSEFPFIRYRTGDVGVLSANACSCGRGLPLLEEIQGRTTDFVIAQDGTVMHGLALIYVLRELPGVENFRITQNSIDQIDVEIVRSESFEDESVDEIVRVFKERLGSGVEVTVDFKEHIEREKSGKFRYVISHVQAPT